MRVVTRALGWTVLRDIGAPRGAAETGMVLIRAQRPVPPAARPGHLARTLRSLRPFQVGDLPAEDHLRSGRAAGRRDPGPRHRAAERRACGAARGLPLRARAELAAGRLRPRSRLAGAGGGVAAVLDGFRPG